MQRELRSVSEAMIILIIMMIMVRKSSHSILTNRGCAECCQGKMQLYPERLYTCLLFDLAQGQRTGLRDPLRSLPGWGPWSADPKLSTGEGTFLDVGVLCEVAPARGLWSSSITVRPSP